jgi:hypothetical protein
MIFRVPRCQGARVPGWGLLGAVALLAALASTAALRAQIPQNFTNLQVLPKDIPRPELLATMKSFALNLGVRCEHCHVGEGNDLSKFDFAADTKPAKGVARRMLRMTMDLNKQVAEVGEPAAAGTPKITCYTCHRGAITPRPVLGGGGGVPVGGTAGG